MRERLSYFAGDFADAGTFKALAERLEAVRRDKAHGNRVFYLATAPRFFGPIVEHLAAAGLINEGEGDLRRVVVEKPFGTDLDSARALNARILDRVPESQVFRIDHFLGKETVQNIMALRFANGFFEPLWNGATTSTTCRSPRRRRWASRGAASFYEPTGALRDMVPNHMFQLLAHGRRWSRPTASTPTRCAPRRRRWSARSSP